MPATTQICPQCRKNIEHLRREAKRLYYCWRHQEVYMMDTHLLKECEVVKSRRGEK